MGKHHVKKGEVQQHKHQVEYLGFQVGVDDLETPITEKNKIIMELGKELKKLKPELLTLSREYNKVSIPFSFFTLSLLLKFPSSELPFTSYFPFIHFLF